MTTRSARKKFEALNFTPQILSTELNLYLTQNILLMLGQN